MRTCDQTWSDLAMCDQMWSGVVTCHRFGQIWRSGVGGCGRLSSEMAMCDQMCSHVGEQPVQIFLCSLIYGAPNRPAVGLFAFS